MNCAECMDALLEAELTTSDLRSRRESTVANPDVRPHISECARCGRAATLLLESQSALSETLQAQTGQPPDAVAVAVLRRYRREKFVKWIVAPIAGLTLVIGALILAANFGRELQRFFAPPPPVETATFTLNCLSGDQAASLLRPYLPRPQNPMWQAEDFDVFAAKGGIKAVTVRAPAATIARVPALLARFEADPQAACRNSVSPPP